MGAAHGLETEVPAVRDRPVLRELQAARTALGKYKVRLQNQLHQQHQRLSQSLNHHLLRVVASDKAELDLAIRAQLETCPVQKRALRVIESIKGIGTVAATTILIEMPEIGRLRKKPSPVSRALLR